MYKRFLFYIFVMLAMSACGKSDAPRNTPKTATAEAGLATENLASLETETLSYHPPDDGKVTDDQMQMYIAVKKLESDLLQASKSEFKNASEHGQRLNEESAQSNPSLLGTIQHIDEASKMGDSFTKLLTLDLHAAKKLGFNIEEYEWVRDSLLAAEQVRLIGADIMDIAYKGQNDGLSRLKELRRNATNPEMIQALDQSIADAEQSIRDMEIERQESAVQTEALRHNANMLEAHADDINVVNSEFNKLEILE